MKTYWRVLVAPTIALVMLSAEKSLAGGMALDVFGTGGDGFPHGVEVLPELVGTDPETGDEIFAWFVHGGFFFDPDGGPIIKHLAPPPGGWMPGKPYTLHEEFIYLPPPPDSGLPSPPLTDWHEEILLDPALFGAHWTHGDVTFDIHDLEPVFYPGEIGGPHDEAIWFFFEPHPPSPLGPDGHPVPGEETVMHIWKEFVVFPHMMDATGMPIGDFPIAILEYPTIPEPATVMLLVFGVLGAVAVRRR